MGGTVLAPAPTSTTAAVNAIVAAVVAQRVAAVATPLCHAVRALRRGGGVVAAVLVVTATTIKAAGNEE